MTFDRQGRGPRMLGVMGIVLGSSLSFAALSSPGYFALQAVLTSVVAALLVATLGAILCRPRAFWAGFAVAGWASLIAARGGLLLPLLWLVDAVYPHRLSSRAASAGGFDPAVYRVILMVLLALVQGLLGGLAALLVAKSIDLRRRSSGILVGAVLAMGAGLSLRFPESPVEIIFGQGVLILLVAALLGTATGPRRRAALCAALAGWAALMGLSTRSLTNRPPGGWIAQDAYAWIYPQVLDPNWDAHALMSGTPTQDWRGVVLGRPPGGPVPMPTTNPFFWGRLRAPWTESPHFRGFARSLLLSASMLAALAAWVMASRFAQGLARPGDAA